MQSTRTLFLLIFSWLVFAPAFANANSSKCDNSGSEVSNQEELDPASAMQSSTAIDHFISNYRDYELCLGVYGCFTISSVYRSTDGILTVRYNYKDGVLRGTSTGDFYSGRYRTNSTSGEFELQFRSDRTAAGVWQSTSFFSVDGVIDIRER